MTDTTARALDALEQLEKALREDSGSAYGYFVRVYMHTLRKALTAQLEAQKVDVEQAMNILWDAGYKIHGHWGWVQDNRNLIKGETR